MAKVLTEGGSIKIGAYRFKDRKKPCLCVQRGNKIVIYGFFIDTVHANAFMDELGKFVGAEMEAAKSNVHS